MPADIRSFFGGGPPKASQGSEGEKKKDEVCTGKQCKICVMHHFSDPFPHSLYAYNPPIEGSRTLRRLHSQKNKLMFTEETRTKESSAQERPCKPSRNG